MAMKMATVEKAAKLLEKLCSASWDLSVQGNTQRRYLQINLLFIKQGGMCRAALQESLCLETDKNKLCNLAICLIRMGRIPEAKSLINDVGDSSAESKSGDKPFLNSYE